MRVLLDECVHADVRAAFPDDHVETATEAGWRGLEDGVLLALAQTRFDVLVTIDRSLEHQNNLANFNLGVVVVHVRSNEIGSFQSLFSQIRDATARVRPGTAVQVPR